MYTNKVGLALNEIVTRHLLDKNVRPYFWSDEISLTSKNLIPLDEIKNGQYFFNKERQTSVLVQVQ